MNLHVMCNVVYWRCYVNGLLLLDSLVTMMMIVVHIVTLPACHLYFVGPVNFVGIESSTPELFDFSKIKTFVLRKCSPLVEARLVLEL